MGYDERTWGPDAWLAEARLERGEIDDATFLRGRDLLAGAVGQRPSPNGAS